MRTAQAETVLRHLQRLGREGEKSTRPDQELVTRFAADRDEVAFAALVERYGPMVLQVCRSVLHDWHDAEDAFQATFLVLARKADRIRQRDSVASWLYGVAYHLAIKARSTSARRRAREQRACPMSSAESVFDMPLRELLSLVHEELAKLPEVYRAPLVLCYLEGKTQEEAARQLGWTRDTTRGRIDRGREQLRKRLARRGVTLAAAVGALLATRPATAAVRGLVRTILASSLVVGTVPATGGISANAAQLAEGAIQAMFASPVRFPTLALLACALVAALAGWWGHQALGSRPGAIVLPSRNPAEEKKDESVVFAGKVLDPAGKPFAGAELFALYPTEKALPIPVRARSGKDGSFRFTLHGKDLDSHYHPAPWEHIQVVARAAGYGLALPPREAERTALILRLVHDDVPLTGRVLNLEGKPMAGVVVSVTELLAPKKGDLSGFLTALKGRKEAYPVIREYLSGFEGTWLGRDVGQLVPAGRTGAEGRFTLRGVGRERVATVRLSGPTIESQDVRIMTRTGKEDIRVPGYRDGMTVGTPLAFRSTGLDHVAGLGAVYEGVVRDRDTGKAIPGAIVTSYQRARDPISHRTDLRTVADAEGRFRLTGMPRGEGNILMAQPPAGQPYLWATRRAPKAEGLDPVKLDFDLKRGIWATGKVTDKATGAPVRAQVRYYVFAENPHLREVPGLATDIYLHNRADDGSFRLVVLPGRGMIAARGTEDRFLTAVHADRIKGLDGNGHFRTYPSLCYAAGYHTLVEIQPDRDARSVEVPIHLDPGKTLTGTVLGPNGKPLAGARVKGLLSYAHSGYWQHAPLPTASFTVTGLAPGRKRLVLFIHESKKLAGSILVGGDDRGPVTVQLAPWGEVTGRLVAGDGSPRPGMFLLSLGSDDTDVKRGSLPQHPRPQTDREGRFRLTGLVPGLRYSVAVVENNRLLGRVFVDLTVKAGEVKDLGDVQLTR